LRIDQAELCIAVSSIVLGARRRAPIVVAYELPPAVASLRAHRLATAVRRDLAQLPETAHPFDR
jgi:predicted benzoate:H+ symporter BenE